MSLLHLFPFHPIDNVSKDILEQYQQIEMLITQIDEAFTTYFNYLDVTHYYEKNQVDDNYNSIRNIRDFYNNKVRPQFVNCYTERKVYAPKDFSVSAELRAEELEILTRLTAIKTMLYKILEAVANLDVKNIKENDFLELRHELEKIVTNQKVFRELIDADKKRVIKLMQIIADEANQNERKNIWLLDQITKENKLNFSSKLPQQEIELLELIPLIAQKDDEKLLKRSNFLFNLHADNTLPIPHYNLNYDGRNIHVIPKENEAELKRFLIAA